MNSDVVAKLFSGLLIDALVVSAPLLLTPLVVGVVISILQVVTQIQEMSLTFVPKIVAAVAVLLVAGPWMLNCVVSVATRLIGSIPIFFLVGAHHGRVRGLALAKLLAALAAIGVLDLLFARWEYGRKLRMSHRDLKHEIKHREGDPRVRSRLRELAARHRVPVVQSPRLACTLYRHTECDQYVPGAWFPLLARILVWVAAAKRMSGMNGARTQPQAAPR